MLKRIGVLMGGLSAERDISLQSGHNVVAALKRRGHEALPIVVDRDLDRVLRAAEINVAFIALHGRYGEDGCVQGLLEVLGIPYTGSGVLASALAMNKVKAKELLRLHNLPTPAYYVMTQERMVDLGEVHGSFGFPVVVKPAGEGSSIGVSLANDLEQLHSACEEALRFDDVAIVERYIAGKEVHVGVLNGRAIGAVGVVSHHELFDYEAKYTPGHAHYHLPARLSAERYRGVLTQALRAHQALGCSGATRVDMIVSDLGNEYILEINTSPGLTTRSLLPRIAKHAGMSYDDLIEAIVSEAALQGGGARDLGERRVRQQSSYLGPERRAIVALS